MDVPNHRGMKYVTRNVTSESYLPSLGVMQSPPREPHKEDARAKWAQRSSRWQDPDEANKQSTLIAGSVTLQRARGAGERAGAAVP